MTYPEALQWLFSAQLHGIKLGLENIARLLEGLGVATGGPDAPRFLHVAGTNGKGSVCAMLAAICRAAGWRTGLYTSPHLVDFRERIRLNDEMIGEAAVAEGLTRIRQLTEEWEHSPTFFEIATALALLHFQQVGAEIVVLETGLGGRLDATNIVTPLISIITSIALDHQQWLGENLAAIAMEKAGIIKPGVPVISLRQPEEVELVLTHLAWERDCTLHLVASPLNDVPIVLSGSHQRWNAALVVHALDVAGVVVPDDAVLYGLRSVEWPGRFQIIGDCVLDGAHNPAAAARLLQTWREAYGESRATLILGILGDKDVPGICAALAPLAARVIAVPVQNPRTLSAEDLQSVLRASAPELPCEIAADAREAIRLGTTYPERLLIAGSLFLVGEALAYLTGHMPPAAGAQ